MKKILLLILLIGVMLFLFIGCTNNVINTKTVRPIVSINGKIIKKSKVGNVYKYIKNKNIKFLNVKLTILNAKANNVEFFGFGKTKMKIVKKKINTQNFTIYQFSLKNIVGKKYEFKLNGVKNYIVTATMLGNNGGTGLQYLKYVEIVENNGNLVKLYPNGTAIPTVSNIDSFTFDYLQDQPSSNTNANVDIVNLTNIQQTNYYPTNPFYIIGGQNFGWYCQFYLSSIGGILNSKFINGDVYALKILKDDIFYTLLFRYVNNASKVEQSVVAIPENNLQIIVNNLNESLLKGEGTLKNPYKFTPLSGKKFNMGQSKNINLILKLKNGIPEKITLQNVTENKTVLIKSNLISKKYFKYWIINFNGINEQRGINLYKISIYSFSSSNPINEYFEIKYLKPFQTEAWIYLGGQLGEQINFPYKKINILYIGFGGVVNKDHFGFYDSNYGNRLSGIIASARAENPNIKIIISQNWGTPKNSTLSALSSNQISEFTTSVANFIKINHLNGYDIDYELNNVTSNFPMIASKIRTALNKISTSYLFTVTSASTSYFTKASLENVNMINTENYSGTTEKNFIHPNGFDVSSYKLYYGVNIEDQGYNTDKNARNQINSAITAAKAEHLGGVFIWRLNSNDYSVEIYAQNYLWNKI